ncbi:MAG: ABC transporter substrate-binding protein [Deltaproteobacteria bacterium]|uniref:ABC transporter substrate-binding protein n=1 Tax=Candidatus Deferrimicrobium sp. TaxID=3060586 RepID=UPI002721E286|nr:ABC transporter substrate-binding protein [Candidatus Deferrimicrobium sp.]MCR4309716.1 ABC transporter substrate-binding protein [Deltaproteobacteria bacterium]MDO8737382.1 ABC transporter substrate-binding protein [Candidatus Deferrimicrobium sp.]
MKGTKWMVLAVLLAIFLSGTFAQAAEPLKIGAILSVTGPASFLGAPEAKTLEMLVAETNKKGGVMGRQVQLIIKDSGASPEKAFSFAKQLIEEEKVFAIIGPSTSGETMKIKSVAEAGKTILLSCAAAEAIVNPVAKYVFKTPQKDSDAVIKIFQEMKKRKISRIGVLSSNTGFGNAGKGQIEKLAPEHGITIVANEVYDKAASDLTAEVTKIKAANVQAIVNWSIEPAQAIVIKNARQIGLKIPIFQSHGFGNIQYVQAAGAAAEGVLFPCGRLLVADVLPKNHPQKALLVKYTKDYESRYKEQASTFGGHAYDAYIILLKAIDQAKSTDTEAVRTAIENLKGFVGTAGIFNFSPTDHNGLNVDAFEMLTVKKGKFSTQ